MPQLAEYIARISGDTSGLEKAIADAKGSVKKLAKDEVLIKLQYDGNVKDFNKQFDKILKDCPELTVQFQYNVNQKMLDKEMEKAKKLQELKLDINTGNVENRIRSMIEGLDNAIGSGESSDIIESKIKEIIRYGNTVKHAGGEIAKTYLKDILESVEGTDYEKLYNKILESPKLETMKLFDINGLLDEELNAAEQRIQDFQSFLQSLESKGASKSGLSSELESLQDEIKILRSDITDMKDELDSVSGEKFHLMTEEIKNVNEQLQIALEKIGKLTGDNKLGSIVNKWNREEITKEAERYTAFNSKSLETSGVHAAADAEGVSEELIRTAISEMGEEADGFIHTHPKRKAAFSDTDISTFYKLLEDGITQQVVTSYEQAMSLDMSKVNPEKKEEVVDLLKKQYDEAEQEIGGEFLRKNLDLVKNIANQVFEGNKTGNDNIDSLLENARKKYNEGLEKLGPEITLNQYSDLIDEALTSAFKDSDFSKMAGTKTFAKVQSFLDQVGDAVVDSFSEQTGAGEVIQERFQHILMDVFSNPDYLKSGIKSAIKLESLNEFIDRTTLKQVGMLGGKMIVDGFREAIDAHSNSKEAERAVDDFANGVVDEFEKRTEDMAQAAKRAGDAVTEAFGNSLKDSVDELDELLPTQGKTSKKYIYGSDSPVYTEDDVDRIYDRHANEMMAYQHEIDDLNEAVSEYEAEIRDLREEKRELIKKLSNTKQVSPVEQFYKDYGTPSHAMDLGYTVDDVLRMLGGKFAEMDVDDVRAHEWKLNLDFFKELLKYAELTEDELDVVKAAMIEIELYGEGGKYRHLIGNEVEANKFIGDRLKFLDQIFKKEHEISEQELEYAKITLKYEGERDTDKKTSSFDENNLLFQESDDQLSMFEEIANAKREDTKATEELIDAEKRLSDIPGQMSIDDFANINKQSDVSSSTEEIDKATEAIKQEGEAAEKSAQQKKEFINANKEVAKSGSATADGINEANEAIKKEGKTVSESKIDVSDFEKMVNVSKDLKEQLGGVVDVYQQIQKDKDGKDKISYRLVGENGYAWVGQNGDVLKKNIKTGNDLTQEKAAKKELKKKQEAYNKEQKQKELLIQKELENQEKLEQKKQEEYNKDQERKEQLAQKELAQQEILESKKQEAYNKEQERREKEARKELENQEKAEQKKYQEYKRQKESEEKQVVKDLEKQEKTEKKSVYQKLSDDVKEYIRLKKLAAQDKLVGNESVKLDVLEKTVYETISKIENTPSLYDELELNKVTKGLDTLGDEIQRIKNDTQGKLNKTYDAIFSKFKSSEYDLQFELDNGKHTAEFNQELSNLIERVQDLQNHKPDIITQQDIDDAQKLLEDIRQIRKSGNLTANKQANENSIQKGLAQINSILSGNTKRAFRRTDVYKDLVELQTLFKSFDASKPQSELAELTTDLLKVKARFEELDETVKGAGFFQTFTERLRGINAQLLAQYFSWHDIIRYGRTMASTIIDLDSSLLDLRKTTSMNATELDNFYHSASDVAKGLGVTTNEIITQASAWSRLNNIGPLCGNT